MTRNNIEQIIRDLFKDNFNAYPNDYLNDLKHSYLATITTADGYWDNRTAAEEERDAAAGIIKNDYSTWCLVELKDLQDNLSR